MSAPHIRQSSQGSMQDLQKKWPQLVLTGSKKRAEHLHVKVLRCKTASVPCLPHAVIVPEYVLLKKGPELCNKSHVRSLGSPYLAQVRASCAVTCLRPETKPMGQTGAAPGSLASPVSAGDLPKPKGHTAGADFLIAGGGLGSPACSTSGVEFSCGVVSDNVPHI
jgi:hypothetical protein